VNLVVFFEKLDYFSVGTFFRNNGSDSYGTFHEHISLTKGEIAEQYEVSLGAVLVSS
jgi:hypothetical protein